MIRKKRKHESFMHDFFLNIESGLTNSENIKVSCMKLFQTFMHATLFKIESGLKKYKEKAET